MAQDIKGCDAFAQEVFARVPTTRVELPRAFYNYDGDCIEIVFCEDDYRAERWNDWVTMFVHRETGSVVGILLTRVREFVHDLLKESPGFQIEIHEGKVRLVYLLTAVLWKSKGKQTEVQLNVLRTKREEIEDLEVDLEEVIA